MHCGSRFFSSEQLTNFAQSDHLRSSLTYFTGGAHLLDYTALKHHFHSLIDSFVKLLPVAKDENACSRDR